MMKIPVSAFWKIESDNFTKGGRVTYNKNYRLRHYSTGKYLAIAEAKPESKGETRSKCETKTKSEAKCDIVDLKIYLAQEVTNETLF